MDSENDIETVGNTSDQESSDDDLTRAPRLRARSIDEGCEIDCFELPPPAKFMNETYGEKMSQLGSFSRLNYGPQPELQKDNTKGEISSFQLHSNENSLQSIQNLISLNSKKENVKGSLFGQGNIRSNIPGFLANPSNDLSKISKNSILGFLASKMAHKAEV